MQKIQYNCSESLKIYPCHTRLYPKIAPFTMIVVFGTVVSLDIKMLSKVDFLHQDNLLVVACSILLVIGVTAVHEFSTQLLGMIKIIADDGIVIGS